jgi:murein DD-endopeptidase MepM/ murein hydrolase activator NlpD
MRQLYNEQVNLARELEKAKKALIQAEKDYQSVIANPPPGDMASRAAAIKVSADRLISAQRRVKETAEATQKAIAASSSSQAAYLQARAEKSKVELQEIAELDEAYKAYTNSYAKAAGAREEEVRVTRDYFQQISEIQSRYNKLKEDEAEARRDNAKAAKEETAAVSFLMPVKGTVTGKFGEQRSGHRHGGIDIAADLGTPVKAPQVGVVKAVGYSPTLGKYVFIDHGGGTQTRFGHLSIQSVGVDQVVQQGQEIGKVGSTGRSTGPHLHYEVRERGKPVDPMRGSFKADTSGAEAEAFNSALQDQHDALIAGALRVILITRVANAIFESVVYSLGNVWRLRANSHRYSAALAIETDVARGVTDVLNCLTNQRGDFNITGSSYFTGNVNESGGDHGFNRYT